MSKNQFALLGTRRFLPLLVTQFLGAFNDNLFKNALVILITFVLAARSGLDGRVLVVLAGGIFIFPFFLFSATAGQLADKYDKALLTRHIKLAEIVIMLAAGLGFWLGSVTLLMAVLFLMGAQSAFFGPIKFGILPDHLADDELVAGNALIETEHLSRHPGRDPAGRPADPGRGGHCPGLHAGDSDGDSRLLGQPFHPRHCRRDAWPDGRIQPDHRDLAHPARPPGRAGSSTFASSASRGSGPSVRPSCPCSRPWPRT